MLTKQVCLLPGSGKQLDSQPLLVAHEGQEEADCHVWVSQPGQVCRSGLQEDVWSGWRFEENQQVLVLDLQRLWEVYTFYYKLLQFFYPNYLYKVMKFPDCKQVREMYPLCHIISDFHL